jgi:predicted DNA repair protein MutK
MTKVAAKKSAAVADDVAAMTKVATQKTAGVLGDDLALNAQQVTGVRRPRAARGLGRGQGLAGEQGHPGAGGAGHQCVRALLITPLLMLGGAFLCFEGVEKLAHKFLHSEAEDEAEHESHAQANANPAVDLVAFEKDKIKGAVRTDFILSAEIIVIALGTVAAAPFLQQVAVLVGIAALMTVGVYGLVGGIVKLDDLGLWLSQKSSSAAQALGRGLLAAAPWLMKFLSVAGTAAMFLVGGGILVHGIAPLHHAIEAAGAAVAQGALGGLWQALATNGLNGVAGIVAGAVVLGAVTVVQKLRKR